MFKPIIFFALLNLACGQNQWIVVDTLYDLGQIPGWTVSCNKGYERLPSDFSCGGGLFPIKVNVPEEDLNGEIGFWTGCGSTCRLEYSLNSLDVGLTISGYFHGMDITVVKNGAVQEIVKGEKWLNSTIDLAFTKVNYFIFHGLVINLLGIF